MGMEAVAVDVWMFRIKRRPERTQRIRGEAIAADAEIPKLFSYTVSLPVTNDGPARASKSPCLGIPHC